MKRYRADHKRSPRLFFAAGWVVLQTIEAEENQESFLLSRTLASCCKVRPPCSECKHCLNRTLVPVNLKEQDAFHLTIEEYLHALISLIEELVRTTSSIEIIVC